MGCDQGDNIVYMIGDGSFDPVWWGSAEVYMDKYELMKGETERPYYTCEDSCIQADMAAALCTGYLNFKDSKPEKAKEYLEHAIDLFDRADKLRAIGDDAAEQPYYKITTFYDDLFYAANWLYMATGEQKYLDLCKKNLMRQVENCLDEDGETAQRMPLRDGRSARDERHPQLISSMEKECIEKAVEGLRDAMAEKLRLINMAKAEHRTELENEVEQLEQCKSQLCEMKQWMEEQLA